MEPAFTRRGCIRIIIITVVGIAILPFTPGFKQQWNLRLAEAHAVKLRPIFHADERFKHVKVTPYTGGYGSLTLTGEVANDADKAALKTIVVASNPPVKVFYWTITSAELHKWDDVHATPNAAPTGK